MTVDKKITYPARAHLFISGRVQCVLFRDSMKRKASELGVKGFVKNLSNGKVEAVIEGDRENINELVKWSQKGSLLAKVTDVAVNEEKYIGEFNDFVIKY